MTTRRTKTSATIDVDSFRHNSDTRTNIPTQELRDFVAADENAPGVMRYPRDPSLDPQLVWKRKDDQDREYLGVLVVPIYIQEKIHPRAIVDDLRRPAGAEQLDLFADFNGLDDFSKKLEFYEHQQHWTNRMILGDSLMVMTSLAEKEALKGKVQTIYLDPPYGIKFGSNWQVSTRKRDVKDGSAEHATRQPEQVKAFRDTWELGIHSYLSYLRDRFVVARDLLTESGSIFVQIGDENVHLVRSVLDEVFGAENFCGLIPFRKTGGQSSALIASVADYLLWYAHNKERVKYRQLYADKTGSADRPSIYSWIESPDKTVRRRMTKAESSGSESVPAGWRIFAPDTLVSLGETANSSVPYRFNDKVYNPGKNQHWKTTPRGLDQLRTAERLIPVSTSLYYLRYLDDFPVVPIDNVWQDTSAGGYSDQKLYVVQTNRKVVQRCVLMTTDPGDLVLDPTCGSGTTAYVAEQWGRRWITIDTSRVALALARTRLMAAQFPFYLLADSPDGIAKETELTGTTPPPYATSGDIRKGFVYKRVLHITLKSIANNPDIREGMSREEIDRAIARHADTETLYDQPYEDTKRVRVSGPFTVESLSPHRVLSTADENFDGEVSPEETDQHGDFASMILENLRKAGVQNGIRNEKIVFDRLEPYAGRWINAEGEYTDAEGQRRRVAVTIGPEHGTVGPEQVKQAALEAVRGIGFDILIVCGFAFDAHVSEEARRYGSLTVLPAKMNPDLALGDEFLKKTGSGNLFMVFGEPDIEINTTPEGIVVTINGLDVYDPTTGVVRPSSTDEIACWFIDADYNGDSFFVRHAYFTGAEEPYTRLQKSLKAEIDEDAWASLYRTESRPFPVPATGKIAVKVINHYGDEVMKVYDVE
jgi:adenine-specific DNA-methyltransferase